MRRRHVAADFRRRGGEPLVRPQPLAVDDRRVRALAHEVLRDVLVPVRLREVHRGVPFQVARIERHAVTNASLD